MTEQKPGFVAQIASYPPTFWVVSTMEIFERMAWYGFYAVSSLYITGPKETGGLGFTSEQRGQIQAIVPFFLYLMPVLTGALADRYGYKKMFIIAYVGMIISYYALGSFHTMPTFVTAFMCVAVAAAIFKPVVVGTVAKVTNESNSATAFGIFYMMVNIGGFFGPIVAGIVRGWDWKWVFVACSFWGVINLIIVTLFYKDPSTEAGSGKARSLQKVLDDAVEVLGNLRFFLTVFVVLISLMVANQEFDWFQWWPHCILFIPAWIIFNLIWDAVLPADSGRPVPANCVRRNPFLSRMHCSNWRFALFLLIMSGFWTSFNQIFLTMPEYIRDFSETKPLVDGSRKALGFIGKPQWARHLASVDEVELYAAVDKLMRQARGLSSAVPPEEEEKDPKKQASQLRGSIKELREKAKRLSASPFLDQGDQKSAQEIEAKLKATNKRDIDAMKSAESEHGDPLETLERVAFEARMDRDPRFTQEVREALEELVGQINTPSATDPLDALDLVEGTLDALSYKVRLKPVEFAQLLAQVPSAPVLPSDEAMAFAFVKVNRQLKSVGKKEFDETEAEEIKNALRSLAQDHGPIVSEEAAQAFCVQLSNNDRTIAPKDLSPALNAMAYRDAFWDKVDARRQFNPEFIVNVNALGIVLFQVLISFLMARFHRFTTMVIGMVIAAVGLTLPALAGDQGLIGSGGIIWLVAGGIFVFSFGEMMASPTSQDYVGRIAPSDKTALYMGYYFVAVALGNLFGGILSGQLYGKLARDMGRPDLMWMCFGAIMLATSIMFLIYNKFALPKGAPKPVTNA